MPGFLEDTIEVRPQMGGRGQRTPGAPQTVECLGGCVEWEDLEASVLGSPPRGYGDRIH